MLGKLKHHDVAGIEMHPQVFAVEGIAKGDHLARGHQIAVEEDVLDVEVDAQLFRAGEQYADRSRARLSQTSLGTGS